MKIIKNKSGYSETTAYKYINKNALIQCVTGDIEIQYEFIDQRRTDNIKGYKLWFVQKGLNPFYVKFETKPLLPLFLSIVELENLKGVEIKNNVYFKAEGIKVITNEK